MISFPLQLSLVETLKATFTLYQVPFPHCVESFTDRIYVRVKLLCKNVYQVVQICNEKN